MDSNQRFEEFKRMYASLPQNAPYKKVKKILNAMADLLPKTAYAVPVAKYREIKDLRAKEVKNSMFGTTIEGSISSEAPMVLATKDQAYLHRNMHRLLKNAWIESGKEGIAKAVEFIDKNNAKLNSVDKIRKTMNAATDVSISLNSFKGFM